MQPNLQRFLPIVLIAFVLLFILPTVLHKSSSKGPSSNTLSTETLGALGIVDRTEQAFKASHRGYTSHVADILSLAPALGQDLADGVVVQLDVSGDGQTYFAQVASNVLAATRGRTGAKRIANGCLVLKSSSGVKCPEKPAPKTTSTSTTTPTTSTTSTASS